MFWYCYASVFFPKFFHLQPHSHLPQLNFSVFLYWKYNIVILYMHTLSKISHPFKPNQTPNVASSVCYIISCMSQPLSKVLCSCTGTQSAKHIHVKCFPGVNFTSLSPGQTQNSIPLGHVNKIMTESIRPLYDMMLPFFQFLKSSGYICNLLSKWHLRETLSNNTQLKTKHFRTAVCQLSCFIDWQEQNWKLSNRNQILALLIN